MAIVLTRNKLQSAQVFPNVTTASPSATLVVIAPPVQVKRGDSWEEATDRRQIIYAGQSVRTLGLGKADVLFEGIGAIRLDQKTEITLSSLTAKTVLITQGIGNTYSKVIKFFDPEQKYEVETPTAVASVRGTAFGVLVDLTYKTSVIVTSNTVAVAPIVTMDGEKKRLPAAAVPEGQATQINKEVIRRAQQEGIPPPVVSKEVLISPVLRQWFEENKTKDKEFDRQEREEKIKSDASPTPEPTKFIETPKPSDAERPSREDNKDKDKDEDKSGRTTPSPEAVVSVSPSPAPSDILHQLQKLIIEPIQKSIKSIFESPSKSDARKTSSDDKSDDDDDEDRDYKPDNKSKKESISTPEPTKHSQEDDKDKPDRATPSPEATDEEEE